MKRKIILTLGGVLALVMLAGGTLYFDRPLLYYVMLAPKREFKAVLAPPAADYTQEAAWLVLPDHPGGATLVPPDSGAADAEATAPVDVFFVHPTTYYDSAGWNAAFDESGESAARLENSVVHYQAAAFNGCCKIYAPRYRQATLYAFLEEGASERSALDLAYQDVVRAFDIYMAKYNHGRPFVLAGHSQGSLHGMRLLQEHIAGTPLAHRLVAAYLVGYSIPRAFPITTGIGPCRGPVDVGCYLTWNSALANVDRSGWQQSNPIWFDRRYQPIAGRPLDCMNPLTWTLDSDATAAANLGGMGFDNSGAMLPLIKGVTGGACVAGMLIVTPPTENPSFTVGVLNGSYHIYDYNLFYLNIRQNLAARVDAYIKSTAANEPAGKI